MTCSKNTQATYLSQAFSQFAQWISAHIPDHNKSGTSMSALTYGGIGDFFMTCTSEASRNFSYGKHFEVVSVSEEEVPGSLLKGRIKKK